LLGDRLRMMSSEPEDALFVRSLSSAGQSGGLAPHCADIAQLLASAGYQIVLVETVGAGQNDTDVRTLTDEVLLLVMPGAGDSVQFSKAGVVEIASGFVVNKADLPGADATIRQLKESLDDDRPVWSVSALRGEGLDPLCDWVQRRLAQRG
jgi:LAO/AO transport system kinase